MKELRSQHKQRNKQTKESNLAEGICSTSSHCFERPVNGKREIEGGLGG